MTAVSLNQPAQGAQDWHTPLNANFGDIEYTLNNHDRLAGPFFCHEQSTPDMTVRVDPGFTWDGGSLADVAAQNTSAVSAPASNDRIDRVVLDEDTGVVSIESGTEAATPTAPAIPAGKIPCAQIYLTPSHASIEDSDITDERAYIIPPTSTMEDLKDNLTVSAQWLNEGWDTGDIKMSGVLATQAGWLLCNGQAVSRTTYSDLFNEIGTTFGNGDGSTTFNVPDFRDRSPVGDRAMNSSDAGRIDNYATTMGDVGGADQHTLTNSEMASHNHGGSTGTAGSHSHSRINDASGINDPLATDDTGFGTAARIASVSSSTDVDSSDMLETNSAGNHNHSISTEGSDAAHNNMHPFIVVAFLIRV